MVGREQPTSTYDRLVAILVSRPLHLSVVEIFNDGLVKVHFHGLLRGLYRNIQRKGKGSRRRRRRRRKGEENKKGKKIRKWTVKK